MAKTVAVTTKNGGRIRCYLSGVRTLADGRKIALAKQRNRPVALVQFDRHPDAYPFWFIITDGELVKL